jgi:hypothetical protein
MAVVRLLADADDSFSFDTAAKAIAHFGGGSVFKSLVTAVIQFIATTYKYHATILNFFE